ncbi:uncharacterized protein [Littorina saxatilis]
MADDSDDGFHDNMPTPPRPLPPNNTTTPPPLRCRTFEGDIISATQDDPVLTRDDFPSCTECFCEDTQYDDDDGEEEGGLAEAVCIVGDCLAPRCVDPVVEEGECCPQCPNGENCYIRQPRPKKKRPRVIPMGRDVRKGSTEVCRCSPDELMFGEPYNTVAVCEKCFT